MNIKKNKMLKCIEKEQLKQLLKLMKWDFKQL